jgi:hypothetical protein
MEAVLPRLIADPDPAEQVNVVGQVQERLGRGRAVGTDPGDESAEDAAVNPAGVVPSARQKGRQRRQQHGGTHPPVAVGSQVAGHLPGSRAKTGEHHLAQVKLVQQHGEVGGERVVVVAHARPA